MQAARRHQRRILAQAVARYVIRLEAALPQYHPGRRRNRDQRRLLVLGEPKRLLRPLETQPRQVETERHAGLFEYRARGGKLLRQALPHSYELRPLSRKQKCCLHVKRTIVPASVRSLTVAVQ